MDATLLLLVVGLGFLLLGLITGFVLGVMLAQSWDGDE